MEDPPPPPTEEERLLLAKEESFYSQIHGRPEKIVFCVDLCEEMAVVVGQSTSAATRLDLLKTALQTFVTLKSQMNSEHEFGLLVFAHTASWASAALSNLSA